MKTQQREINEAVNAQTTAPTPEQKSIPRPVQNKTSKWDQFDGIERRGIPELKSNNSRNRYEHDLRK